MKSFYIPHPMFAGDEEAVRNIHKLCYPGTVRQPEYQYFVHPTLCVTTDSKVVGFTSFTTVVIPGFGETMYGKDLCVHPDYRGRGIARCLHAARLAVARSVRVKLFMGVANKENKAMIRILEESGMHACVPMGEDVLFVGLVERVM